MELNEMEKRVLYQTEGSERYAVLHELYCTPVKFAVQPDCRPPAMYLPRGITVNPGGLQYSYGIKVCREPG